MKVHHILIASAALAVGPAIAQDVAPQATGDCATLQAQLDQAASTASSEQMSAAQAAIDEGKKLCAEGRSAEGAAKLQEAMSVISPTAQPTMPSQSAEQPATEQPPTDTEQPPTEQPPQ